MRERARAIGRRTRGRRGWVAGSALLAVVVLAGGLVFGSGTATAETFGGARSLGETGPGATAADGLGISPGPGYTQIAVNHKFFVKPGINGNNCGHIDYLEVQDAGEGTYLRQAYKDGALIQTYALTNLRDSFLSSSGYDVRPPDNYKLAQISGSGLGCAPSTATYVARVQADAFLVDYEVWFLPANKVPTAAFDVKIARDGSRKATFTNRSIDVEDGTNLTYTWNFGDGKTSTETSPVHTYAADGDYSVTLTAKDTRGAQGTKTTQIEVGPPLDGALFAFPTGDLVLKEEERVGVRLRVENDGDEPLSDVAVTSIALTPTDPEGTGEITIAPKVGGEALSGSLGTGADRMDFADYDVVAKKAGTVEVAMRVEADLPDGTQTSAVITQEVEVRPAPIRVDLEVHYAEPPGGTEEPPMYEKDNNGDGKVDERDHRIEIDVTATNRGDEPVSAVEVNDAAEPIDFDDKYLGGGEVYLDPIEGPHDTEFGDLDAGESQTLTFVYEAKEPVWADATSIVKGRTGGDDGPLVTGVGRTVVKLDTDLALQVSLEMEQRPYEAGQVVRLHGTLKNILEDKKREDGTIDEANDLAVILDPIVEGNAANGYAFPGDWGGRTPQGNTPFIVKAGETVSVGAILATARKDVPTTANVRYLIRAWESDPEDAETVMADEIDQSRVVIDEEDGHGTEFSTDLAPVSLKPDKLEECETEILDAVFTCNLWVGLREFGTGLAQLGPVILQGGKEFIRAGIGITAWVFHIWADEVRAFLGDEAARQRLITEIEVQMQTWVEAKIIAADGLDAVGNSVVEFFREAETALKEGDTNQIVAWSARYLGENPDLGLAAIAKIRAARALFGTALPSAAQSEATSIIAKAADEAAAADKLALESKIDEAIAKGENPATNGTFKGDEDITNIPRVFRGIYGARKTELNKMLELARKENILIAFRQRSARAADLIRDGLARPKPMDIKTKGVNEIDIHYLGYRREAKDLVELVEPPIDWRLAKKGNEAAFETALDDYMDFLKSQHPEIAADAVWASEVRSRLKTRTKQWVKEVPNFRKYKTEGINVEFGYAEQGMPASLDDHVAQTRKARVNQGTVKDPYTGKDRLYFNVEMADEFGNNFLPITGDIDIVAILNADRSPLTDVNKRARIYKELAKLVGMQHGDSFTWINNEGMIEFMREHIAGKPGAEALVVAGSDGRARMGYFEERLSTVADADGNVTSKSTFHMLTGGPRELVTDAAAGTPTNLPSYFDELEGYALDPTFFVPGALEKFMDGVEDTGLAPPFDPTVPAVQPDGEGGALTYEEGGIEGDVRPDPSAHAASRAAADVDPLDATAADIAAAGFGPAAKPEHGAQGGRWVPFDAAAAAAASPTGRFPRGVITALDGGATAGSTVLSITPLSELGMAPGSPWFRAGDTIVVDPGGANEERHVVAAVSPFTTVAPLAHDHRHATSVVLIPRAAEPEEPEEPVEPTTPTTPTTPTAPTTPTVPGTVDPGTGSPGGDAGGANGTGAAATTATGSLPRTGSSVTDVLPLAIALVLGGVGVLALRTRTRRRATA
ncbi:MAG TPA: PKD domain-containing protein [Acidimicrobiales bacterium]|nr:PKD domain-containing protein [Acidimicrobiales bacterium]